MLGTKLYHVLKLSFLGFAAEYAGKPLIPPYFEPNADHSNGVNFGSGGAGVLVETHQGLVTHTPNPHHVNKGRTLGLLSRLLRTLTIDFWLMFDC